MRNFFLSTVLTIACLLGTAAQAQKPVTTGDAIATDEVRNSDKSNPVGTFEAGKGTFLLNGKPFVVKAAELHYPRIPKPYWDQRIKLCKALGMNTICLYVFWNSHEPQPGVYNFSEQNDLAAFCRLCQQNGMYVILRPGPYVCAEWEMGGLPWWLLKKKDIRLREPDPYFIERVALFEAEVAKQVKSLTIANGGPIIMVQVENEYGSYGANKGYVSQIRDIVRTHFGDDITLFQCDWSSNFTLNGLDDLIWTMNFGTGANIDQQFAKLKELRPDSPLMCSEFWSGWFDKWGANHETRPADDMIKGIDDMLSRGISFSLYMTHGGTNWGHWAGANSPGFAPDVTSYDYDAPISESGQTTPKYWKLRETLSRYMDGEKQAKVPALIKPISIPAFRFTEMAPLFDNLPAARKDENIRTMEEYDQGFGSILYRTSLPELKNGATLTVNDAHDFAQVFIDGRYIGKLDRRNGEKQLALPACHKCTDGHPCRSHGTHQLRTCHKGLQRYHAQCGNIGRHRRLSFHLRPKELGGLQPRRYLRVLPKHEVPPYTVADRPVRATYSGCLPDKVPGKETQRHLPELRELGQRAGLRERLRHRAHLGNRSSADALRTGVLAKEG